MPQLVPHTLPQWPDLRVRRDQTVRWEYIPEVAAAEINNRHCCDPEVRQRIESKENYGNHAFADGVTMCRGKDSERNGNQISEHERQATQYQGDGNAFL